MALPDTLKIVAGTPLVFANSGEYVPTDAGQPSTIDADIDLGALGVGALRQSVKLDLGSANLDVEWETTAYIEFHSAPTAGGEVSFYLGFSSSATAGQDNPGNLSGTDAAYVGYGAAAADGIEALPQLMWIGSLIVTADADIQVANLGTFMPLRRYASLVVYDNTDTAIANTDAIETGVAITPLQHQIQD